MSWSPIPTKPGSGARAVTEAERENTAAAYELETAQAQLRQWEDAILKAEGELSRCQSVAAGLEDQRAGQREELEQLKERTAQIEADTPRSSFSWFSRAAASF